MRPEKLSPENEGALGTPEADDCQETTILINIENIYIDQGSHFTVMPPDQELSTPDLFEVSL